jgi:hypothetical protein
VIYRNKALLLFAVVLVAPACGGNQIATVPPPAASSTLPWATLRDFECRVAESMVTGTRGAPDGKRLELIRKAVTGYLEAGEPPIGSRESLYIKKVLAGLDAGQTEEELEQLRC